jgi:hypothetical protein
VRAADAGAARVLHRVASSPPRFATTLVSARSDTRQADTAEALLLLEHVCELIPVRAERAIVAVPEQRHE